MMRYWVDGQRFTRLTKGSCRELSWKLGGNYLNTKTAAANCVVASSLATFFSYFPICRNKNMKKLHFSISQRRDTIAIWKGEYFVAI